MNKKGFTLVELLATIVVLGILITVTMTSVNGVMNNSKNNISDVQMKMIKETAKAYSVDNLTEINKNYNSNNMCYISFEQLENEDYIDDLDESYNKSKSFVLKVDTTIVGISSILKKQDYSVLVYTNSSQWQNCIDVSGNYCYTYKQSGTEIKFHWGTDKLYYNVSTEVPKCVN